jgi:surfactin synthase thioesterase subunit
MPTGAESTPVMRLVCLPYAGGSAAVYRRWNATLGPRFPVVAVELPGHGRRIGEPLRTSATSMVDLLVHELITDLSAGPFAIFGHSMGGLLAFQLTHELVRRGLPVPMRLFLSAARPPGSGGHSPLHDLPRAELVAVLDRLNGAPAEVLASQELMELLLPTIRADLYVAETWSFRPTEPLGVAVSLLGGLADPLTTAEEMDGWRPYFTGEVERRDYAGDHFYLNTRTDVLLHDLKDAMSRAQA